MIQRTSGCIHGLFGKFVWGPLLAVALYFFTMGYSIADEWIQGQLVRLQMLDKITARIATIDVRVGEPAYYGSLYILARSCSFRPPTVAPEHAALLEVRGIGAHGDVNTKSFFRGWMFASNPSLSALEHSVYDISVLSCQES